MPAKANQKLTVPVPPAPPFQRHPLPHYRPYAAGAYKVEPGLAPLERDTGSGSVDTHVFQFTKDAERYLANKRACMEEDPAKYYATEDAPAQTMAAASQALASQLRHEWGIEVPAASGDSFCRLALNVPEDLCVVHVDDQGDRLVAAHVCAPSHWAPREKIGKNFRDIHAPVPGIDSVSANASRLIPALVRGRYKRLGWSLTTDDRLNHHPDPPPGFAGARDAWVGKTFDPEDPKLFVRIERQTLLGLPEVSAFVFTIRVYFRDCTVMPLHERSQLAAALRSMSRESRIYKGIDGAFDLIVEWLDRE